MKRPNVIFILADDLGYGDLGLFGNGVVRTPHLDRLGREGVVLSEHYSASPLCAPARAGLLTGRYPQRCGAIDVPSNQGLDRISLRERTVADLLGEAGYATGMIGKWHNGLHDMRYHPNSRGFGYFLGFLNGGMDYYRWQLDVNGVTEPFDGRYLTDVFSEAACAYVREHRERPFFLYLAYNCPHTPLQAPEELVARYRALGTLTEEVCQLYAMVERMDAGIGELLTEVDAQGLREETLVVFTSDNGPWMAGNLERYNGPLRGVKGEALEGGIRVPCLVRYPGVFAEGVTVDAVTHFCDWLPTLLAVTGAGVRPPYPLDGADMSGLLRDGGVFEGGARCWQRNRYLPVAHCNGAIRQGRYKVYWPMREGANDKLESDNDDYVVGQTTTHRLKRVVMELPEREVGPEGAAQLYDVVADPGEARDLAGERPEVVAELTAAWDQWFAEVTEGLEGVLEGNVRE